MAITTFAELKSAIGSLLDHSLFTTNIPDFIALFDAAASRRPCARQMEVSATLDADAAHP